MDIVLSRVLPEDLSKGIAFTSRILHVRARNCKIHQELQSERPYLTSRDVNIQALNYVEDYSYAERLPELELIELDDDRDYSFSCIPCYTRALYHAENYTFPSLRSFVHYNSTRRLSS
mmetsp:Transcript_529/g.751  ORF Transcript_529/g.751 Transcript_529/m.751 type:complete len:118 (+) Transcript_529:29-382(+)